MAKVLKGWKAIANYLGTTYRTIQRWEAKGLTIPVWQVDRDVMIHEDELIRWLKKHKRTVLQLPRG
jgi:excisionase family DNA binding protein